MSTKTPAAEGQRCARLSPTVVVPLALALGLLVAAPLYAELRFYLPAMQTLEVMETSVCCSWELGCDEVLDTSAAAIARYDSEGLLADLRAAGHQLVLVDTEATNAAWANAFAERLQRCEGVLKELRAAR